MNVRDYLPPWAHEWIAVIVPGMQIAGILVVAWLLQHLLRRLLERTAKRYQLPMDLVRPVRTTSRWIIYGAAMLL
ncbi:MAG: mechanosensitive ion channel protein MscS, partial [Polaromonas sp.]|nr:mechanosensitive ion channel protein MscS [Polaromonas sp.]